MPTRHGWTVAIGSLFAVMLGRVFAIVELFVIAAGLSAAVLVAVAVVRWQRPRLVAHRWVHPSVLTVGDTGRVDLLIQNEGPSRSGRAFLTEPVGPSNTAKLTVAPMRRGEHVTAGYRVPASRRGVLTLGPLEVERRDILGLASATSYGAASLDLMVAPRTVDLAMPELGHGVLGRHLMAQAQRMGAGEFHSLRDYVVGDEPRTIHWGASAKSDGLKVRKFETQGVRRCVVVLDTSSETPISRRSDVGAAELSAAAADAFERAIVAAASLVNSADHAGLTTRFVTSNDIDLRGPDVASQTLKVLAPIDRGAEVHDIERDPGEGLGLVVVVTTHPDSTLWRRTDQFTDPTLTRVGVFTMEPAAGRLSVDASSVERFTDSWAALAGSTRLLESRDHATVANQTVRSEADERLDARDREWQRERA